MKTLSVLTAYSSKMLQKRKSRCDSKKWILSDVLQPKAIYANRSLLTSFVWLPRKFVSTFLNHFYDHISKTLNLSSNFGYFINSLIWDNTIIIFILYEILPYENSFSNFSITYFGEFLWQVQKSISIEIYRLYNYFYKALFGSGRNIIAEEIQQKALQVVNTLHIYVQELEIYVQGILLYYIDLICPICIKSSSI